MVPIIPFLESLGILIIPFLESLGIPINPFLESLGIPRVPSKSYGPYCGWNQYCKSKLRIGPEQQINYKLTTLYSKAPSPLYKVDLRYLFRNRHPPLHTRVQHCKGG